MNKERICRIIGWILFVFLLCVVFMIAFAFDDSIVEFHHPLFFASVTTTVAAYWLFRLGSFFSRLSERLGGMTGIK